MTKNQKTLVLLIITASAFGCSSLPKIAEIKNLLDSRDFQCHSASPGPCSYAIFNESGSIRETFILTPGESRSVGNIQTRTTFCLAANKPLNPATCERLGLNGKPISK